MIDVIDPESLVCHDPPILRNVKVIDLELEPPSLSSSSSSSFSSNSSHSSTPSSQAALSSSSLSSGSSTTSTTTTTTQLPPDPVTRTPDDRINPAAAGVRNDSSRQSSDRKIKEFCPPIILSGIRSQHQQHSGVQHNHHHHHHDEGEEDAVLLLDAAGIRTASFSSDTAAAAATIPASPPPLPSSQTATASSSYEPESDGNHVQLQELGSFSSTKTPTIVHKRIGDRHTMQCHSLGMPVPKIHWILPSGEVVNESSSNSLSNHVQLLAQGSLRLFRLSDHDAGNYTCVASNQLGEDRYQETLVIDMIDIHILPLGTRTAGGMMMLHEKSHASSSTIFSRRTTAAATTTTWMGIRMLHSCIIHLPNCILIHCSTETSLLQLLLLSMTAALLPAVAVFR